MKDTKRYLIITENENFINNMFTWFEKELKNGEMEIDVAKNREEAEKLLESKSYNKIFHNGMYIIDLIERYQSNADIIHEGETKNKIFQKTINGKDKKEILELDRESPLYLRISVGWVVSIIAIIISSILYINSIRTDVNVNKADVTQLRQKVEKIENNVEVVRSDVGKLLFYFENYLENNNKGERK